MRRFVRRDLEIRSGLIAALGALALTTVACGSSSDSGLTTGSQHGVDGGAGASLNVDTGGASGAAGAPSGSGSAANTGTSGGGTSAGGSGACVGASCGVGQNPVGKPAAATCGAPDECASGRCEPVTGVAKEVCLSACFADGVACEKALDCCSTGCHAGVCSGLCTVEGDSCKANADCCSGNCDGGRCAVDLVNRDCRPTGEDCTSGSGRGCCNECNKKTKRCDFGADTCFAEGVACQASSDCCRGECTAGVCKTPCAADGAACSAAGDCCSATCDATGTCATKKAPDGGAACSPTGTQCATANDCCSLFCFGGFCEPPLR
jgi:hypothetical protein